MNKYDLQKYHLLSSHPRPLTFTHHVDPGCDGSLGVDLDDGGDAVLVLHVVAISAAVGVECGGDVGEAAKELVGRGARGHAGRVCRLDIQNA